MARGVYRVQTNYDTTKWRYKKKSLRAQLEEGSKLQAKTYGELVRAISPKKTGALINHTKVRNFNKNGSMGWKLYFDKPIDYVDWLDSPRVRIHTEINPLATKYWYKVAWENNQGMLLDCLGKYVK